MKKLVKKSLSNMILAIFVIMVLIFTCQNLYSQPGTLDPTFGTGGVVQTDVNGDGKIDKSYGIATQKDNKPVICGSTRDLNGVDMDAFVARYNTDGTLDNTFAGDGVITLVWKAKFNVAKAVAIQDDGKIVVTGYAYGRDGFTYLTLARFDTYGDLDNTFGTDGLITNSILGCNSQGLSLAIQSNGKIVVAGIYVNTSDAAFLMRFNSNGSIDITFSGDGIVPFSYFDDYAERFFSVQIDNNGKIVVGGEIAKYTPSFECISLIARFNSDGSWDNDFGNFGANLSLVTFKIWSEHFDIAIQDDGKIVGTALCYDTCGSYSCNEGIAIARFNSFGFLDNTFNGSGIRIYQPYNTNYQAQMPSIAIQQNGKIVIGFKEYSDEETLFDLMRLNTNGTLDMNFGMSGFYSGSLVAGGSPECNDIALQPDGKIVVTGGNWPSTITARYIGDAIEPKYLDVLPTTLNLASDGTSSQFDISSNTSWTITHGAAWITDVSPANGSNNGAITVTTAENSGTDARSATITITGTDVDPKTVTVTQDETIPPYLEVAPHTLYLKAQLNNKDSCVISSNIDWAAGSIPTWLTVNPTNGYGDGKVIITAQENLSVSTRTATITISGEGLSQTVTVTQGLITHIIDLSAGWTWFSMNLTNTDMSLGKVLSSLKSNDGDYIKNQTVSSTYYEGTGWFGELMQIDPKEMYKIKLGKADTLRFEGSPVDPSTNPINIKAGWNWIGYLPQSAKSVMEALSAISPVADDYIKNQTKSSTFYEGFGWFGELNIMEPRDGYMLKTSHPGTLVFPISGIVKKPKPQNDFPLKNLP